LGYSARINFILSFEWEKSLSCRQFKRTLTAIIKTKQKID
jgi:hypothetical protein